MAIVAAIATPASAADQAAGGSGTWYKGNIHCHSLWSDGDQFPEMVAAWYKDHGYQFLAVSDHNVLMQGQKWVEVRGKKPRVSEAVVDACRQRFGNDWIETRSQGGSLEVRLKTLDEFRGRLEEPGRFLMIEGEEISGKCGDHQVHLTAVNLAEPILPATGPTPAETLALDLVLVTRQARQLGRPIFAQVNHPNWRYYDIAPEDLASARLARWFEICNASPGQNREGEDGLPSLEKLWDIANTIRVARMKQPPLYGTATDDAHSYHTFRGDLGNPGRGWIMVRAPRLSADGLLAALKRGDFYASTGVILDDVRFDAAAGELSVAVKAEPGAHYTIDFVGTPAGYDPATTVVEVPATKSHPARTARRYSPEVGKLLLRVEGPKATYRLKGNELYVRAIVHSDQPLPNPIADDPGMRQQAWGQPVGWPERIESK